MAYHYELPLINALTTAQQLVLNELKPIAVSGGPGTGKSVVSLWRHIQNYALARRKSLLLTYTKSLESFLKSSAKPKNEESGDAVNRTYWWLFNEPSDEFDEIIIDEAQDVEEIHYESIKGYTKMVSYSADNNQILYPDRQTTEIRLRELFPNNTGYDLDENFRNTFEISTFTQSIFPGRLISNGNTNGPKPSVICTNDNSNLQNDIIIDIINEFQSETHNIGILVPLANPALHRQRVVLDYYRMLINKGITCSYFENENGGVVDIENIHITTFKSAKGLEFDTVIIPDFNLFKLDIADLYVVAENDYYVVFTRARRNLILLDNSSISAENHCNLVFLQSQIKDNIISVNYDYINNDD